MNSHAQPLPPSAGETDQPSARRATIHVVPFSHMDFGWTYYAGRNLEKIGEKVTHIVEGFVEKLEADPRTLFTGLGTFPNISQALANKPDLVQRVRSLVRSGRLCLPGHLVNMPNLGGAEFHLTPESLIRNLVLGRKLHQRIYGKSDGRVLHFPDVTGSFGNLPQILSLAGYKAYRFDRGWHGALPNVTFRWRGIDGSEVIANRANYCGNLPDIADEEAVANFRQTLSALAKIEGDVPLLHHYGHDLTEADADELAFVDAWNREYPDMPMALSTYDQFFEKILDVSDNLPVFEGAIDPLGWTATFGMNGYRERKLFGDLFDAIQEVEIYASFYSPSYPGKSTERAWHVGLSFQEHGATNFLLEEDSRQVREDINRVRTEMERRRDSILGLRASALDGGEGHSDTAVVFNPLPWPRREAVAHTFFFAPTESATAVKVFDPQGNQIVSQLLSQSHYPQGGLRSARLLWMAEVPACGDAIYVIKTGTGTTASIPLAPTEANEWDVLENDVLRAAFKWGTVKELIGRSGAVFSRSGMSEQHGESIVSNLGAVTVLPAKCPDTTYNWGMLNRFGKPVTLMSFPFRMTWLERGPIRSRISIVRDIQDDRLEQIYTMTHGKPYLDMEVMIKSQRSGYRWEMGIPFKGLRPQWTRDEAFGRQAFDPAHYSYVNIGEAMTPGGFFCQSFVDARFGDGSGGVTVLAPDHPGYVASGDVLNAVLLFSPSQRLEDRTCRFVMSPETRGLGVFDYHYRLWTYTNADDHQPERRSLEMRFPMRVVAGDGGGTGSACPRLSQLSLSQNNITYSAFYRQDGRQLLRVYETEGHETEADIYAAGTQGWRETDLLGKNDTSWGKCKDGWFKPRFRPYEIKTIELSRNTYG